MRCACRAGTAAGLHAEVKVAQDHPLNVANGPLQGDDDVVDITQSGTLLCADRPHGADERRSPLAENVGRRFGHELTQLQASL